MRHRECKRAIYAVTLEDKAMAYKTIGNEAPVGICGTGVMDITAELIKHEIVDETGLLCDEYFETGFLLGKSPVVNRLYLPRRM